MLLQGCRSATPQGLRTTCTEACSIAIGCPDPKRAYRSDKPLVDTVIGFGVAKASRFGLLQHPITLTSQMATSATDRKVTDRILRCGQNCSDSVFVTRE